MAPWHRLERSTDAWTCKSCKDHDGKPFKNKGFRTSCFKCNLAKGVVFLAKVAPPSPSVSAGAQAVALRERERKVKEAELKRREAAVAKAEGSMPAGAADAGTAPQKDQAKIAKLRADLEALEAMEDSPAMDALRAEKRGQLQSMQAAKSAAKPYHVQVRELDEKIKRKDKVVVRLESVAIPAAEKTVASLRTECDTARQERTELQKQRDALVLASVPGALPKAGASALDRAAAFRTLVEPLQSLLEGPSGEQWKACLKTMEELAEKDMAEAGSAARVADAVPPAAGAAADPARGGEQPGGEPGEEEDADMPEAEVEALLDQVLGRGGDAPGPAPAAEGGAPGDGAAAARVTREGATKALQAAFRKHVDKGVVTVAMFNGNAWSGIGDYIESVGKRVLVAVRSHVRSEVVAHWDVEDISPAGLPGRLAARWLNLWSGVVVMAAYFVDSVGWDAQNMLLAGNQLEVDKAYAAVIGQVEQEILGLHDLVGADARRYEGRGQPLGFRERPVRGVRQLPARQSRATYHLRALSTMISELWHVGAALDSKGDHPQRRQRMADLLHAITRRARWVQMDVEAGRILDELRLRLEAWAAYCRAIAGAIKTGPGPGPPAQSLVGRATWRSLARSRATLDADAEKSARADAAAVLAGARQRYAAASAGNAGALHRLTRPLPRWQSPTSGNCSASCSPQAVCAAELDARSQVWQANVAEVQEISREWLAGAERDEPLPAIAVPDLLSAAAKFKVKTGLGVESWNPRALGQCSLGCHEDMVTLLHKVEASLMWPSQVSLLVYLLIPKADSGKRPIAKMWLRTVERDYDWARRGGSSEKAVWRHLVEEEGMALGEGPDGQAVATVLLDLVKCFEKVQLRHVWRRGQRWGFPPRVLRLILASYSLARALLVDGCHSECVAVVSAIVPGSRFALAVLHLVLLEPCDLLRGRWHEVSLAKYVDDMGLACYGVAREVETATRESASWLIAYLWDELQIEVSLTLPGVKGKSKCLATSQWLSKKLGRSMARLGVRLQQTANQLGIDRRGWASGRRPPPTAVRKERFARMAKRRALVAGAKRWGGKVYKVTKAGLKPSVTYGCRALGLKPLEVHALRAALNAGLPSRHRHRSTTLRLAIFGQVRLMGADSWSRLAGPASTCILVLRRLGWSWPAWHVFMTRDGHELDLRHCCPVDAKAMALKDSEAVLWSEWIAADPARASLQPAPFIDPLRTWFTRHLRRWSGGASAAAQAVAAGPWTQHRAYEAGAAATPWCRACAARGIQ
ncbi:unnamed protein product, partial [Prorocentrum cordatum]